MLTSAESVDRYFFNRLGNALDKYTKNYKKKFVTGDFNAEDSSYK